MAHRDDRPLFGHCVAHVAQHGGVSARAALTTLLVLSCAPAPRAELPTSATASAAPLVSSAAPLRRNSAVPVESASAAPALSTPSRSTASNATSPEPLPRCGTPNPDPRRAVCAPGKRADQCAACPAWSSFLGEEGGDVHVLAYGSFTGSYEEALVALSGCGHHSEKYGGTALLRAVDGGFVPIVYVPGFTADQCEKVAISGVDRLACREKYALNGRTAMTMAAVADFKARRIDTLLSTECESGVDVEQVKWIESPSLGVSVRVSYGVKRSNDGSFCRDLPGQSARSATLEYGLEGIDFVPSTSSKKLLARFGNDQSAPLDPEVQKVTQPSSKVPKEWLPSQSGYDFIELCDPSL
jgi:hypothetical protein